MKSYPLIHSTLSETQEKFISLVESRVGLEMPGRTVGYSVREIESDDVVEWRHTISFLALTKDGHREELWSVEHSLTELQVMGGRRLLIQSAFDISGVGESPGYFDRETVEQAVEEYASGLTQGFAA